MPEIGALETVAIGLAVPVGLGLFALWIWMLIDCLRNEDASGQERLTWVIVIVFLKFVGAAIYYFMKYRPRRAVRAA